MVEDNAVFDMSEIDVDALANIFGDNDRHLKLISDYYHVNLTVDGHRMLTDSPEKQKEIKEVFDELLEIYRIKKTVGEADVLSVLYNKSPVSFYKEPIGQGAGSRRYYLRSMGQKKLYNAFEEHDITVVTGPAGTGKTFLAVLYAANLLKKGHINKIIITRPVVEAGESLGYLPGDLKEKIDPYLRPIYDALDDIFGQANVERLLEKEIIEIAPLAYMRGRTLNDSCVILDEAQNTTEMQIKMFLTRLGFNSRMIITGDITQVDLPPNKPSGLKKAIRILKDIDEIAIVQMHRQDIVRHPLVQKIIEAYEKNRE